MGEEQIKKIKEQQEIEKKNFEIINEVVRLISNYIDSDGYHKLMELIRKYRKEIYDLKIELQDDLADAYSVKQTELLEELENFVNANRNLTKKSIANWVGKKESMDLICKFCEKDHIYPIQEIKEIFNGYKGETKVKGFFDKEKEIRGIMVYNKYTFAHEIISYFAKNLDSCRYYDSPYRVEFDDSLKREVLEGKMNFFIDTFEDLKKYNRDLEYETNAKVSVFRENQILEYYEQELEFWRSRMIEKSMGDIEVDYE